MEINTVETSQVEDFFSQFLPNDNAVVTPVVTPVVAGEEKKPDAVADFINTTKEEPKKEETDFRTVANSLIEEKFLFGFEGEDKVETPEDFKTLLEGNINHRVDEKVREVWENQLNTLPPDAQLILEYSKQGVTDARDFLRLITNMSARNEVVELDPKKEPDQERIVMIQLVNSGMPEASAKEMVQDLKTANKLAARATEYHPILKKAYEGEVRKTVLEKQQIEQERNSYINNNAVNAEYFLNNEDQFLPFKISDVNYKTSVYHLAAKPVAIDNSGEIVYGWQQHIKKLQEGDEADYKQYMKVMAFLANSSKYDENISTTVKNSTNKENFKKVAITTGKQINQINQESQGKTAIRKPNSPWTL